MQFPFHKQGFSSITKSFWFPAVQAIVICSHCHAPLLFGLVQTRTIFKHFFIRELSGYIQHALERTALKRVYSKQMIAGRWAARAAALNIIPKTWAPLAPGQLQSSRCPAWCCTLKVKGWVTHWCDCTNQDSTHHEATPCHGWSHMGSGCSHSSSDQ